MLKKYLVFYLTKLLTIFMLNSEIVVIQLCRFNICFSEIINVQVNNVEYMCTYKIKIIGVEKQERW